MNFPDKASQDLWYADEDPGRSGRAAASTMIAQLAAFDGLKPFPASVQRVLDRLSAATFDLDRVVVLIEEDPPFAVKTLRVANSAAFASRQPCKSVRDAVIRVGRERIKEVALLLGTMAMFKDVKGVGRKLRVHCVRTAGIARGLSECVQNPIQGMFLAGLLHDVGRLVLLQAGHEPYVALQSSHTEGVDSIHHKERALLGYDHAVLGAHLLETWNIPHPIPRAVAWHHQPQRALAAGGDVAATVALVRLADFLDAELAAAATPAPAVVGRLAARPESAAVGLTEKDLRRAWPELRVIAQEIVGAVF
jgi:HD-like signal output (HDOD) protein